MVADLNGVESNQTETREAGAPNISVHVIAIDGTRKRPRPSELLPWADPYIASLVRQLQHEVRSQPRADQNAAQADLEWRFDEPQIDFEPSDREPAEADAPGASSSRNW